MSTVSHHGLVVTRCRAVARNPGEHDVGVPAQQVAGEVLELALGQLPAGQRDRPQVGLGRRRRGRPAPSGPARAAAAPAGRGRGTGRACRPASRPAGAGSAAARNVGTSRSSTARPPVAKWTRRARRPAWQTGRHGDRRGGTPVGPAARLAQHGELRPAAAAGLGRAAGRRWPTGGSAAPRGRAGTSRPTGPGRRSPGWSAWTWPTWRSVRRSRSCSPRSPPRCPTARRFWCRTTTSPRSCSRGWCTRTAG